MNRDLNNTNNIKTITLTQLRSPLTPAPTICRNVPFVGFASLGHHSLSHAAPVANKIQEQQVKWKYALIIVFSRNSPKGASSRNRRSRRISPPIQVLRNMYNTMQKRWYQNLRHANRNPPYQVSQVLTYTSHNDLLKSSLLHLPQFTVHKPPWSGDSQIYVTNQLQNYEKVQNLISD